MIITFMGNDGSGKTTIATEIVGFFEDLGFQTLYKHEYEYILLRYVFKLIGKRRLENSRKELLVERKKTLTYKIYPLSVWVDLFCQYVYFKLLKKRDIIILDRYPYDQYLSFKFLGNITRLVGYLYLHFPRADLGIVLTVKPELAYERKKSTHAYSLIFYQKQTSEYLNLAKQFKLPLIRTDQELDKSLKNIFLIFFQEKRLAKMIIHKGLQNRMLFHVMNKYNLMDEPKLEFIRTTFQDRKNKIITTINALKQLLDCLDIKKYALIKTIDEFSFVGNDVDVLVSSGDFEKIYRAIQEGPLPDMLRVRFNPKKDKGKMDIIIKDGLNIDLHSYIGWKNIPYFRYEDFAESVHVRKIHGVESNALDSTDNIIIIMYHILEKGFITYEEYMYVSKYWNASVPNKHNSVSNQLGVFISWLEKILQKRPKEFPVFIPLRILINAYFRISSAGNEEKFWRFKLLFRDLSIVTLWRIRYFFLEILPFEIRFPGDSKTGLPKV